MLLILVNIVMLFSAFSFFSDSPTLIIVWLFAIGILLIAITRLTQEIFRSRDQKQQPQLTLSTDGITAVSGRLLDPDEKKNRSLFLTAGIAKISNLQWQQILSFVPRIIPAGKVFISYIEVQLTDGRRMYLLTSRLPISQTKLVKILEDYRLNGSSSALQLLGNV